MADSFTIDGRLTVETEAGGEHYRTLWCYTETTPGIGFNLSVHYDWRNGEWVLDNVSNAVAFDAEHNETPLADSEVAGWWEANVDEFNEELGVPVCLAILPEQCGGLW